MGDRLATIDMDRKLESCVPFEEEELGADLTQCRLGRGLSAYQVASWSIHPFGHNRHGPKIGDCCAPFLGGWELGPRLIKCGLGRGPSPYQMASWSIPPFDHNRHWPAPVNFEIEGLLCPFRWGQLRPHLTQCGRGRGLSACQASSWFIQLFGHNTPTLQTGQRDRQTTVR